MENTFGGSGSDDVVARMQQCYSCGCFCDTCICSTEPSQDSHQALDHTTLQTGAAGSPNQATCGCGCSCPPWSQNGNMITTLNSSG